MRTLIGFTGYIGTGKTSAGNILAAEKGFTTLGFADGMREMMVALNPVIRVGTHKHYALADGTANYQDILRAVGYEGAKQLPEVRAFLQRLGTEAVRNVLGADTWVSLLARKYNSSYDADIVVTDVRFENEVSMIRSLDGFIVRVIRTGQHMWSTNTHVSESGMDAIEADYTIIAESLEELRTHVLFVYEQIQEELVKRQAILDKWYAERAEAVSAVLVKSTTVEHSNTESLMLTELEKQGIIERVELPLVPATTLVEIATSKYEGTVPLAPLTPEEEACYAELSEKHGL